MPGEVSQLNARQSLSPPVAIATDGVLKTADSARPALKLSMVRQAVHSPKDIVLNTGCPRAMMPKIDHRISSFVSALTQDAQRRDVRHKIVGITHDPGAVTAPLL